MIEEKLKILNRISAVINYPDKKSKELAILCPGYLDSKDYNHLIYLSKELVESGFTVVRFDPTGTWDSEGNISDYNISQYLNDIRFVIDYMLSKDSYSHIILGGHSIGGMVSLIYAGRDNRISKVLAIMPPYALVRPNNEEERGEESEWKKSGFHLSSRNSPTNKFQEIPIKVPYSFIEFSRPYNLLEEIKKVNIPIFLVAGELDEVVSPSDVKLIYDQANEPKQFILLEKIGHDYRHNIEEIKIVNQKIIKAII